MVGLELTCQLFAHRPKYAKTDGPDSVEESRDRPAVSRIEGLGRLDQDTVLELVGAKHDSALDELVGRQNGIYNDY
jgi:hypothetical protein